MATRTDESVAARTPLSRDRILSAAIELADEEGIDALTMRNLGRRLGVEAMSLYNHVDNKEDILDGIVDVVANEMNAAVTEFDGSSGEWKSELRRRILAARQVLLRHKWAPGVIETRSAMSLPVLEYYDGVIGILRRGGFSVDLGHHAMHALGSRVIGFTQELYDDSQNDTIDEASAAMLERHMDRLPYIAELAAAALHVDPDSTLGWCDDQTEFEFSLDLILDGLERLHAAS
jgi:AcrR family transcriptional regulator